MITNNNKKNKGFMKNLEKLDNLNFHVNDPRVIKGSIKLYQEKHGYENKQYYSYC